MKKTVERIMHTLLGRLVLTAVLEKTKTKKLHRNCLIFMLEKQSFGVYKNKISEGIAELFYTKV